MDKDECWEFYGSKTSAGYGQVMVDGVYFYAHILAYRLFKGLVPKGQCVCHTCDNPPCCNPAHLFLGSKKANADDRDAKGRQHKHEARFHRDHMSPWKACGIVALDLMGHGKHLIAEELDVSPSKVTDVLRGKSMPWLFDGSV